MLRLTLLALGASLAIGAATADPAMAQSGRDRAAGARDRDDNRDRDRRGAVVVQPRDRDRDRRDRDYCYDRNGRRIECRWDNRDWDRDRRDRDHKHKQKARGRDNGPAFCRNGHGHPVFGMAWCRDKGHSRDYGRYSRVRWDDVILRRPRYHDRNLSRSVLEDILGRTVFLRFDRQRDYLGYRQPLYGRWAESSEGAILRLFSGAEPIAQLYDRNRDGRADVILLLNR